MAPSEKHREIGGLRAEMHQEIGGLRTEIHHQTERLMNRMQLVVGVGFVAFSALSLLLR